MLLDTDVLIDVALKREPFFAAGAQVIQWAQETPGQAAVAWHSLSNVAYLVRPDARGFRENLLRFVEHLAGHERQKNDKTHAHQ